jgi:DNA-binding winged helix-turn-helix (wHTH) protein/TolB-like protein/Flp pilus assembly protein TadD
MSVSNKHLYEFGSFRLDTREHLLLRNGERVKLEGKVFETLVVLVQHSGRLVSKNELMNHVWPDAIVEENNLEKSISVLRKVLGKIGSNSNYIETVRGLGYRFISDVREFDEDVSTLVRHESRTRVIVEDEEIELAGMGNLSDDQPLTSAPYLNTQALANAGIFLPASATRRWWANPRVIVPLGLLTVLGAVGYFFLRSTSKQPETVATVKSIAVLPFKPLGADASDEYLGLGLTDALITRLGGISQITVPPTSTVKKYASQEQDPVIVGRDLSVESVLEGSIQRVDDRFRLTVQLVRVADGRQLWTDKFDEKRVSARVAEALALKLNGDEKQRLTKRYTENSEAYQLYLKGRYYWNKRSPEGLNKGIECFNQAIALDPNYALAYAGLADCHNMLGDYALMLPNQTFLKGMGAASKALELDETLAEAHASLALAKLYYEWDFPGAEKQFQRALHLNPNYATAHQWYGEYLMLMGRADESLAEMRRAQELDPLSLIINTAVGYALWNARRYDEAIDQLRKTLELDANFLPAVAFLDMAYERKGMDQEFIASYQKEMILSGYSPAEAAAFREIYFKSGMHGFWLKILAWLKQEQVKRKYLAPIHMALGYVFLGQKDQAFAWLEKAYAERSGWMVHLKVDPRFDSLRSDPRFADLVRRVGLPQ